MAMHVCPAVAKLAGSIGLLPRKECSRFFGEIMVPAMVIAPPEDIQSIADTCQNFVDQFKQSMLTLEQLREKLNEELSGSVQID